MLRTFVISFVGLLIVARSGSHFGFRALNDPLIERDQDNVLATSLSTKDKTTCDTASSAHDQG